MILPKKLLPSHGNVMYAIRFTSPKPPFPYTPFHICLIDTEERGFLYRLIYEDQKECYHIHGPDIQVQGILLGIEDNSWTLEKASISYQEQTLLFSYNGTIGERSKESAIYIPVSYKPLIDMKPIYDAEYLIIKERILQYTVELTLLGSFITAFMSTIEKGCSFGIGGSIGYLYISLLEMEIDKVGSKQNVFIEQLIRLGLVFGISASIVQRYQTDIMNDSSYFFLGVIGFMMHRIALLLSYIKNDDKSNGSIT